jgi:hypothetical protein
MKEVVDIDSIIKGQWDSILNRSSSSIDYTQSGILNVINNSSTNIDYGNIIQSLRDIQNEIDKINTKGFLTIKNPERLNTNDTLINGEWGITYGGRDLSINEDNYCWIITNRSSGLKGYYIVERELVNGGDWVWIRWGRSPINPKERREAINKSRLKDKDRIVRDMVSVIENSVR